MGGLGRRRASLSVAGLLLGGLASEAAGQELEVRVGREPYYVGVPVDVEVHSEGFAPDPEPSCSAEPQTGGKITLVGISPNISSSLQIVNGQIFRSQSVRFTCHFRFLASQAGRLTLGPFTMKQGARESRTGQYRIEVNQIPLDGRMKVRVLIPSHPVYLGQRVPIEIEWWLGKGLEDRIHSYAIRSPLFDMDDSVRFTDDALAQRGDQALILDTAAGELRLKARTERRTDRGESYLVLSAQRTLIPLRAGRFSLGPAHIQVEEITRYTRDLFGRRSAADTKRLLARDLARTLVVEPPPFEGRPASFAGAVGRGFSFDVAADRSVVQVGDPIALTFTIGGDGNMETLGLPALAAAGGLSPDQFRLPDGDLFGDVDEAARSKSFQVAVRVLDESVSEIPAISFSWFDPEQRRYETTQSRPIALSVRPAQVVAAGDVVSATSPEVREQAAARTGDSRPRTGSSPPSRSSLAREGVDLSVERDVSRLRGAARSGWSTQAAVYGLSTLVVAGSLFVRRRNGIDPALLRRRELLVAARGRLAAAEGLAGSEALAEVAAALRELLAGIPDARSAEAERLLQQCDDALYAPGGGGGTAPPDVHARARQLIDAVGERPR